MSMLPIHSDMITSTRGSSPSKGATGNNRSSALPLITVILSLRPFSATTWLVWPVISLASTANTEQQGSSQKQRRRGQDGEETKRKHVNAFISENKRGTQRRTESDEGDTICQNFVQNKMKLKHSVYRIHQQVCIRKKLWREQKPQSEMGAGIIIQGQG